MFTHQGQHFLRDGREHLVVSGAFHYSRIHPGHWADRLRRLRAMGANAVETYVPWNFHAPAPGVVDFDGARDLGRFLDLAAEADLDIIVRPGPYVCAEWEGGGFPGWLLRDPAIRLRCMDERYLTAVDAWFDTLLPHIVQRQYPDGGRVIMVQVENEYGSYGDDRQYLAHVRDGLLRRGVTVPLVTSDGPARVYTQAGTVDGVLPTINFGSRAVQFHEFSVSEFPDSPPMCMEFWNGWFDHWGERHHVRPASEVAQELDDMLSRGMSANFYMAHGGTNFGLWSGCNFHDGLQPTITSYDYDAPIAENGRLTDKFDAYREVIGRYVELPEVPADLVRDPASLPETELPERARGVLTLDALRELSAAAVSRVSGLQAHEGPTPFPPSFEELGLERGLLLLRASFDHPGGEFRPGLHTLRLHGLRDRAVVFVDGVRLGIVERDEGAPQALQVDLEHGTHTLEVLVESQGRINFGPLLGDRKGLLRGAWFGTHYIMGWEAWPLPLDLLGDEILAAVAGGLPAEGAGLLVTQFDVASDGGLDAFLDTRAQTRGFAFAGPEMLGRYWRIGPQQTLYVPAPLLGAGTTPVTLVTTDGEGGGLSLAAGPILDELLEINEGE
ncbi:beta-galactosidase family protein [Tessaracoccus sp. ZS01]|uniref:glycoside hydrolase family 35 protein n=1 Tax=Tessaracoccus sp. ZS01 TaxID=1906324 RepID=UPI00096DA97A|nr:beta-galactosidase family protein [Tessaracoccus sp. ZS01]MCG6568208.1 beta-galactosidase [Tessaracoccus sp. ZS01]OMG53451.1 hypothetical protein BJN44_11350 [Tessaracoccus sp. ZS01]